MHGFPVVGETDELILTVKHAETRGYTSHEEDGQLVYTPALYADFLTLKPVQLNISSIPTPTIRIYDIVSNIGSDNPYVFTPYDYSTETTIGEPGKTYIVKAKVEILAEGFVPFLAIGLDGDKKNIGYAIGKDETMTSREYHQEGETYIDHLLLGLPVRGQGEPTAIENYPLPEPEDAPVLTHEEIMDEFEEGISSHHLKENSPSEDVLEELVHHEFTIQHMREFLENKMNYSENVINDLIYTLPNDYLGTPSIATGI